MAYSLSLKTFQKNIIEFYKLAESFVVKLEDSNNMVFKLRKLHVELDEIGIQESVSNLGNYKLINIEKKSLANNFSSSTSLVDISIKFQELIILVLVWAYKRLLLEQYLD